MQDSLNIDRAHLLRFVLIMEAGLLLIATVWLSTCNIDLASRFSFNGKDMIAGLLLGLGLACSSLINFWLGKFPAFKILSGMRELLVEKLAPVFSRISIFDIILIALSSGFCEEVLFRGVIQNQFGLFGASIMFGLVHTPGLKYLQYVVWATVAGFVLGILYNLTGTLWAPITAHVVNNLIGLSFLRWLGRSAKTHSTVSK